MNYRTEIDGLRAIAVLSVLFFHANFSWFSGGFIGVDVFFVISGYLISNIILSEIQSGNFSLSHFYLRRARRILPVLFFVCFACLPLAWAWMSSVQLQEFAQSLIAVSLFVSNFFFLETNSYFSAQSIEIPLLHTWSLAVEEQFYILFPIFVIGAWKLGYQKLFVLSLLLTLASLSYAQWYWAINPPANFYLLTSRAWELLIGVMASLLVFKYGVRSNNVMSLLGFVAIIGSIFLFNEKIPYPGLYTLIPTLGTFLVLLYGHNTRVGKILSLRPVAYIGLISYSAYLWHVPLFAFVNIKLLYVPSDAFMGLLIMLSLLLAIFTWKFVEQPFRNNNSSLSQSKVIIFGAISCIMFLCMIGLLVQYNNGFAQRIPPAKQEILKWKDYDVTTYYNKGSCFLSENQSSEKFDRSCISISDKTLIWGDSLAAALFSGWGDLDQKTAQLTASGCPPLLGVKLSSRPHCEQINNYVKTLLTTNKIKRVILHADWFSYDKTHIDKLNQTLEFLTSLDLESVIIGAMPYYEPNLPDLLLAKRSKLNKYETVAVATKPARDNDMLIKSIVSSHNMQFVSLVDIICQKQCDAVIKYNGDYSLLIWDYVHLTKPGALEVSNKIIDIIGDKRF